MAREGHLHQEHAAAAVARLTGCPGGAAGPGVTNTITAVKNAQLAQSPIVLIGGAAPTGRCRPGTDGGKHCAGPIVCCSPVFRLTSASTRRSAVSDGTALVKLEVQEMTRRSFIRPTIDGSMVRHGRGIRAKHLIVACWLPPGGLPGSV
jgi:hypothetical protein